MSLLIYVTKDRIDGKLCLCKTKLKTDATNCPTFLFEIKSLIFFPS